MWHLSITDSTTVIITQRDDLKELFGEAAIRGVLQEKVFLEISQNPQENTCARVSFLIKLQTKGCNFIKKDALEQMFSCEFW